MTVRQIRWLLALVVSVSLAAVCPRTADAQQRPTGLEIGGLPALNFDSDEGVGYGALVELYQYGQGGLLPYVWSLRPTVFLTSRGRRDFTLFFDAPRLLSNGWRLDAYLRQ